MVQPGPVVIPAEDVAAYAGPYDPQRNGSCGCHGTPVNGYGRCQPLNAAFVTAVLAAQAAEEKP